MPPPIDDKERARAERRRRALSRNRKSRLDERHGEIAARIAAVRAAKAEHPVLSLEELDKILPPVPCLTTRKREARNSANESR